MKRSNTSVLSLALSMALCTTLAGCASAPNVESPAPAPEATSVAVPEQSEVLARKEPGAVRCPKKAKLVKGKCILPVEETE